MTQRLSRKLTRSEPSTLCGHEPVSNCREPRTPKRNVKDARTILCRRQGDGRVAQPFGFRPQSIDSQHLAETFEDAGGNAGPFLVEPAGEVAQQPLGLLASSSSQAWRSARRTDACRGLGSRSITLRALWIWQRWIGVWA